jgi:hypothetical protein
MSPRLALMLCTKGGKATQHHIFRAHHQALDASLPRQLDDVISGHSGASS